MKMLSVLGMALCMGLSGPAAAKAVMHLVEHADTDAIVDTGTKGDSPGDLLTFANPVFDASNKTQVGTDQGFCVRTVAGVAWECWWTLFAADGQLTVQGPFLDKGDSVMAITGGTGKYVNARGQMKLHSRNEKGSEFDFIYEIE